MCLIMKHIRVFCLTFGVHFKGTPSYRNQLQTNLNQGGVLPLFSSYYLTDNLDPVLFHLFL